MSAGLFGICEAVVSQLVTAGIVRDFQIMVNGRLVKSQWLAFGSHITQRLRVETH